jgi:phosphoribosylformylglycinamidine synthase subunit PurQ / glutaminase
MSQPRALILRAPGTNCDVETAFAFELAGAKAERLHINRLLETPGLLAQFQILCVPGGFSYGDDIAAGRIFGNQIQHHLADWIRQFQADGKLILGICNGFQVLMKTGVLLEPDPQHGPLATLAWNDSGRYEDRWVRLKVEGSRSVLLAGIESMYLPVAHAEGKFVVRDPQVFQQLEARGQVVLRYQRLRPAEEAGNGQVPYPDNPNGSTGNAAGICDATGRVLGLMPHPERHVDPTQHPRWTRGEAGRVGDGLAVFVNAVQYFA